MDQLASPGVSPLLLGEYTLPLTPGDYVRRNIRVTPLPVPHELPVATAEALPEVPVFSSDYPHFEASGDPIGHYRDALVPLDDEAKALFLRDNLAECLAGMGDPLAVTREASGD